MEQIAKDIYLIKRKSGIDIRLIKYDAECNNIELFKGKKEKLKSYVNNMIMIDVHPCIRMYTYIRENLNEINDLPYDKFKIIIEKSHKKA